MKIIKFRIWDSANKMFHYWGYINQKSGLMFASPPTLPGVFSMKETQEQSEQFIGILDKNKKEIYEKDLVKNRFGEIYRIDWYAPWACFLMAKGTYIENIEMALELEKVEKIDTIFNCDLDYYDWEVIGNIYQNKDIAKTLEA